MQDDSFFSDLAPDDAHPRAPRGIQSVEVGGQLLKALAHTGRRMALKDLARAAGMTPAKAHPYLVSFGKLGLITQDPVSGHYGLGPLAIQLGLISLQQLDPIRLAIAQLPALAQQIQATVAISVWGTHGPTIIRVEESPTDVHVAMRHGTNASVRLTASGKVLAAFMPRQQVEAALAQDGHAGLLDQPDFAAEIEAIRRDRISVVSGGLVAGIGAIAVPVFDGFGHVALSISAIGPSATLDLQPDGAAAQALHATAQALSRQLGAPATPQDLSPSAS
ncbi:MAG: IclR family transcriptional regulator [Burkholderiaceae bacterium]|nr:IclR family transcriptional regulator [Burkholderiaceae bacterium]